MVFDPKLLSRGDKRKFTALRTAECSIDVTCKIPGWA